MFFGELFPVVDFAVGYEDSFSFKGLGDLVDDSVEAVCEKVGSELGCFEFCFECWDCGCVDCCCRVCESVGFFSSVFQDREACQELRCTVFVVEESEYSAHGG